MPVAAEAAQKMRRNSDQPTAPNLKTETKHVHFQLEAV